MTLIKILESPFDIILFSVVIVLVILILSVLNILIFWLILHVLKLTTFLRFLGSVVVLGHVHDVGIVRLVPQAVRCCLPDDALSQASEFIFILGFCVNRPIGVG